MPAPQPSVKIIKQRQPTPLLNLDLAKYSEKNYVEISFKNGQNLTSKGGLQPLKILLPGISNPNSNRNSNVGTPIRGKPMQLYQQ